MSLTIRPVQTGADQRAFYDFAWRVYKDDPHWVPHLWPQRKEYLDHKAAFFTSGEGEFWLAEWRGEVVGTLGTAVDEPRNRHSGWRAGIFGFFETLPDYEVAAALWDHASGWARSRGLDSLIGPYSFAQSDDPGFLVEGFDTSPTVLMGHTPPYYAQYAERYGFRPFEVDLAYRFDLDQIGFDVARGPAVLHRVAARALRRRGDAALRPARLKEWDTEIRRLHDAYNRSLAVLPEFAPMPEAEFRAQADGLRAVLDPDLVLIAEVDSRCVGFALGLPNVNEALIHANGLRHPWDYARFALARRRITGVSFKILAIDPAAWGFGLDALMFLRIAETAIGRGYTWIDGSLTNERNPQTNRLAARLGARVYRKYYEYRLDL